MNEFLSNDLLDEAVGEVELGGLGGGEARFELVAQHHQLIDLGDDAVLFGKGWKRYWEVSCVGEADIWLSVYDSRPEHIINSVWAVKIVEKVARIYPVSGSDQSDKSNRLIDVRICVQ